MSVYFNTLPIPLFLLLYIGILNPVLASESVFGATDAVKCYELSQFSASENGLSYCNSAILKGSLSKRDLAATYSNRGLIYSRLSQHESALKDHNRAIELRPELAPAYINRGNALYRLNSFEDAMQDYEKAISIGWGPIHLAHYNKGLIYLKSKNKTKARAAFRKALEISPDSKMIRSRLESISD